MTRKKPEHDLTSDAIHEVVKHNGAEFVTSPKVSDDFALGQGRVFRVEFVHSNRELVFNYVYYDGRSYRVFPRSRDLVQFIARVPPTIISRVLQFTGASGFIAVLITITICYLALQHQQIPDILSHALTAILGFYFATAAYESLKNRDA